MNITTHIAAAQPRGRTRLARVLRAVLAGLVLLALSGAAYQAIGESRDRREAPAPGRLVDVAGARMHLNCSGEGSPTIILEAGATGFAQTWEWVQPQLAASTRVCSYDRAGLGWSDANGRAHDGTTIARNLRRLLDAAGEHPPYVVAGHSLGGTFAQIFAGLFAQDVVGVGLLDPSHPDQLERFGGDVAAKQQHFRRMIYVASAVAPFGIIRATNVIGQAAQDLPERAYRSARMFGASSLHLRTAYAELAAWDQTMRQARLSDWLDDTPLVVISATEPMADMPVSRIGITHAMHAELAALSSRGRHVTVPGSDHLSVLMRREHAIASARHLEALLEEARLFAERTFAAGRHAATR